MKLFVSVTAVLFAISCSFSFSADTEAILVGNRTYGKLKPKDMLGYVDKYILNKVKFSSCDGTYTQDIDEGDFERADIKCEDLPEKRPPALISMEKRYQYFEVSNSYKIFDGSGLLLNEVACSEVPKEYIVASAAANNESSSGILFSDEGLVGDQKYLRDVLSKGGVIVFDSYNKHVSQSVCSKAGSFIVSIPDERQAVWRELMATLDKRLDGALDSVQFVSILSIQEP